MTAHADRFTGRVAEYVQYRQQYDAEPLLALLRAWCGLVPEQTVADIGAGTGMLAEVSLRNGNAVVAVEPNAAMRAACKRMQVRWPRLRVIDAAAELTTLAPQSIDLVSVGRAFHWFDAPRALAEFRRILKPGGWVALVSLGRAKDGSEMSAAYERLLTEHGTDYSYVREGYRVHEWLDELFAGGEVRRTELHGEQQLTRDALLGQTMSLSMAPLPGHAKYEGMVQALNAFFAQYAVLDVLTMPTTCWITCGRW